MSKYIVKNCPCIDTTDAHSIFNCECLNRGYKEQWRCYDKDCLIKQVIELCKQKVEFCKNCSKHANVSIDCVECDERGEATLGKCILQLFEIEGCE